MMKPRRLSAVATCACVGSFLCACGSENGEAESESNTPSAGGTVGEGSGGTPGLGGGVETGTGGGVGSGGAPAAGGGLGAGVGGDLGVGGDTSTGGDDGDCNLTGEVGLEVGLLTPDITLYECDGTPVQFYDLICQAEYTFIYSWAGW